MANKIQEWEDFPGGETNGFVSEILGEIGIKIDDAEVISDLSKNKNEEIEDTLLISEPQPQIQRQNEFDYSEDAYMDEYIIGGIDGMILGIVVNCLILDLVFIILCLFYLHKMCPLLKQKISNFKSSKMHEKEEDQVSASTPSTIKKENVSIDNVGFETE